jgi:(p)ppGpp synthase/HD superfamily hydrolase
MKNSLKKAIQLAVEAHEDQLDKGGNPYINHPIRVMDGVELYLDKIVAVLHDVIEDTDITSDDLRKHFSEDIVQDIEFLSKKPGQTLEDYIEIVKLSPRAIRVKIQDLKDNMDLTRLSVIKEKDIDRYLKYAKIKMELEIIYKEKFNDI